jgi:hypothetical protein
MRDGGTDNVARCLPECLDGIRWVCRNASMAFLGLPECLDGIPSVCRNASTAFLWGLPECLSGIPAAFHWFGSVVTVTEEEYCGRNSKRASRICIDVPGETA